MGKTSKRAKRARSELTDTEEHADADHPKIARVTTTSENDDPSSWHQGISSFQIVKHFAIDGISDKKIRRHLQRHSITTLEDLVKRGRLLIPDILESNGNMCVAIMNALKRKNIRMDDVLGGETIFDAQVLSSGHLPYAADAVSVSPENVGDRGHKFALVLGLSGSGKTYIALYRLPELMLERNEKNTRLVIHFQLDHAVPENTPSAEVSRAIAAHVERLIERKLKENPDDRLDDSEHSSSLDLLVIIDEAGGYQNYFGNLAVIREIVLSLENGMVYKFQGNTRLAIVGTGLETETASIKSLVDCTKFRTQDWKLKNFYAVVEDASLNFVKWAVDAIPVVESLISNARCAEFLLRALTSKRLLLRRRHLKQFVGLVVASVAEHYIASNGLQDLHVASDKWNVAKYVFQAIDRASKNPTQAFFPTFHELTRAGLKRIAFSLVSINVEMKDGKEVFMSDNTLPVSMTPALAVVLANLLNAQASVACNWQEFESTVVLCEWKRMITHSTKIPGNVNRTIVELRAPVPAKQKVSNAKGTIEMIIPKVNCFTVVLNGPKAPYADVIAPFRLAQAKHSEHGDKETSYLNIFWELDKMGLTNNKDFRWQQAITSCFCSMWESDKAISDATEDTIDCPKDKLNVYYPYNSLLVRWVRGATAAVACQLKSATVRTDKTTNVQGKPRQQERILEVATSQGGVVADFYRPVTAIFATNCKKFVLTGTRFEIRPEDVDWDGELTKKMLPLSVTTQLRKNVLVRFMFC